MRTWPDEAISIDFKVVKAVDMAKEMTNFTKQNILSQAMLAQANAAPQGVLILNSG